MHAAAKGLEGRYTERIIRTTVPKYWFLPALFTISSSNNSNSSSTSTNANLMRGVLRTLLGTAAALRSQRRAENTQVRALIYEGLELGALEPTFEVLGRSMWQSARMT